MQTFLPYPDFKKSAACLDNKRLGKQRVEAFQILKTLTSGRKAWSNHPATKMWSGYEMALAAYMDAMIIEWTSRGFNNSMRLLGATNYSLPPWFNNSGFHASHRSNLLRKAPDYYSRFGWTEAPNLAYVWPVL